VNDDKPDFNQEVRVSRVIQTLKDRRKVCLFARRLIHLTRVVAVCTFEMKKNHDSSSQSSFPCLTHSIRIPFSQPAHTRTTKLHSSLPWWQGRKEKLTTENHRNGKIKGGLG